MTAPAVQTPCHTIVNKRVNMSGQKLKCHMSFLYIIERVPGVARYSYSQHHKLDSFI